MPLTHSFLLRRRDKSLEKLIVVGTQKEQPTVRSYLNKMDQSTERLIVLKILHGRKGRAKEKPMAADHWPRSRRESLIKNHIYVQIDINVVFYFTCVKIFDDARFEYPNTFPIFME